MAEPRFDLVIVGGGIAGCALATAMVRDGYSCLVLEKSTTYPDRVRGEWIAPWGVVEARRLGLLALLEANGGHYLARHIGFGEDVPAQQAIANALDMTKLIPGVRGPLCIRHPVACQLLADEAAAAGATVLRGVADARCSPGGLVTFRHDGVEHRVSGRLVVGADGRESTIRRQAGIPLYREAPHHLFTGMLVADAGGWPDDVQTKGTEGEVNFLAFPQSGGYVRLYLGYALERKGWLAGAGARRRLLDAFRLTSVPWSDAFRDARAVSPCNSYPNSDSWTDEPFTEGVVLIGDAAGHNDPIIGQGLSITLRDVRIVSEALRSSENWSVELFREYAAERRERLRRLRFAAWVQSVLDSEFGPEARNRRARAQRRMLDDPSLRLVTAGVMVGPEVPPSDAFTEGSWGRLVGEDRLCPESVR